MSDLITTELVRLDADLGSDKHDVIRAFGRVVGDPRPAGALDPLETRK